jgi:hypothetical protein
MLTLILSYPQSHFPSCFQPERITDVDFAVNLCTIELISQTHSKRVAKLPQSALVIGIPGALWWHSSVHPILKKRNTER